LPARVDTLAWRTITNTIGAIYSIPVAKAAYNLYRDWRPYFVTVNTAQIDPTKVKTIELAASDQDDKDVKISSNLILIDEALYKQMPLKLKPKQEYSQFYL
jgi:hypothetical protein